MATAIDRGDIEIPLDRLAAVRRADQIRFIRLETMQGKAVFVGIDGHGAQPQFGGGAENADGDFTSIGDENFAACDPIPEQLVDVL